MTLDTIYFQPDTSQEALALAAAAWFDAVGDLPFRHVDAAFREWLRTGTRRPSPAEIRDIAEREGRIEEARAYFDRRRAEIAALPPPQPQPERVRVTPEAAARILEEAGMSPARLAAIAAGRRMPPPSAPGYVAPPEPESRDPLAPREWTAEELAAVRKVHRLEEVQP